MDARARDLRDAGWVPWRFQASPSLGKPATRPSNGGPRRSALQFDFAKHSKATQHNSGKGAWPRPRPASIAQPNCKSFCRRQLPGLGGRMYGYSTCGCALTVACGCGDALLLCRLWFVVILQRRDSAKRRGSQAQAGDAQSNEPSRAAPQQHSGYRNEQRTSEAKRVDDAGRRGAEPNLAAPLATKVIVKRRRRRRNNANELGVATRRSCTPKFGKHDSINSSGGAKPMSQRFLV